MNTTRWPCLCERRAQVQTPPPFYCFSLSGKAKAHGHLMNSQVHCGAIAEAPGLWVGKGGGV